MLSGCINLQHSKYYYYGIDSEVDFRRGNNTEVNISYFMRDIILNNFSNLNASPSFKIKDINSKMEDGDLLFHFRIELKNRTGQIKYSIIISKNSTYMYALFEQLIPMGSDKNKINSTEHKKIFENDTSLLRHFNNLIGDIIMKIYPTEFTDTKYTVVIR